MITAEELWLGCSAVSRASLPASMAGYRAKAGPPFTSRGVNVRGTPVCGGATDVHATGE